MADDQPPSRTRSSTNKAGDLKKIIINLLTNDKSIISAIADTVLTLIVEKVTQDESFIEQVSNKVSNSTTLTNSVSETLRNNVTREIHESLSYDIGTLSTKIETLQVAISDLKSNQNDKFQDLQTRYDNLEQYGRRNCLIVHGLPEQPGENTDDKLKS